MSKQLKSRSLTSLAIACVACSVISAQVHATARFSPATRAHLAAAALNPSLPQWQRDVMRRVAESTSVNSQGANGSWTRLPPPTLNEPGAAYDRMHDRLLLFGGETGHTLGNDLWALNLGASPSWSLLATVGTRPSPRSATGLVYDPANDQLWLFGGSDGPATLNDVWKLPLGAGPLAWSQVSPSGVAPSARAYFSATLDSLNDQLVIYGGAGVVNDEGPPSDIHSDVWTLTLSGAPVWTMLTPSGSAPSARAGAQMIWDGAAQRLVVFGGFDGSAMLNDLHALSLSGSPAWSSLPAAGGPPAGRAVAASIWDPAGGRMLVYGGVADGDAIHTDLWALTLGGSPSWAELTPAGGPPSLRQMPVGVFDSRTNSFVMYGCRDTSGSSVSDLAWSVNLGGSPTWTQVGGAGAQGRHDAAGIFDPVRQRLISFGGQWYPTSTYFNDVWAYDLAGSWSQITPGGSPPPVRMGHAAIYDPVRDRMLVFGGGENPVAYNDVWELSLAGTPSWSQLATTGGPPAARFWHVAIYDSQRDRMVIQGGSGANDTWALDLATNTWTQIDFAISGPGGRWNHSAVYDALHDRIVLFGGPDKEVWALNFTGPPSWAQLAVAGTPPHAQIDLAAAYDPVADAMVLFGGATANWDTVENASTALILRDGSPMWLPLDFGSDLPLGRRRPVTGYDPVAGALYVTGGCCESLNDTWVATFDRATPVTVSLVSANALADHVVVTWSVSEEASNLEIDRNDGSGWRAAAVRNPDGAGRVRFEDWSVSAGHRYGYRLLVPTSGGTTTTSEAWVSVPALELALAGFQPNPAAGNARVSFRLGSDAPARLEVIDITGRSVFAREVGSLGAGTHAVSIGHAATGLYVLRLTQSGYTVSKKATLMR